MNGPLSSARRRRDDGQIIVIFALALIAIVGMVGLVLDGGSTFAQRRSQQSAADLAAMGAANQYLITNDKATATTKAEQIAAQNGFDVAAGATVAVSWQDNDTDLIVDLTASHRNSFAAVMGFASWPVSVTATVDVGIPDGTNAGGPFIFNQAIFSDPGGIPLPQYSDPNHPFVFGDGNGPIPNGPSDMAWTCYGTCGNLDSNTVRSMVDGTSPVSTSLDPTDDFNDLPYIGQYNSGNHATLFGEIQDYLAGDNVDVPIVDDNGIFQGWATFHVTAANQGAKQLVGYFVSPYNQSDTLEVHGCTGSCPKPRYFGSYTLRLIN